MQSQVGLPLVFQYNTNNNTTQSHHHNVSLFGGGGQKASYFTSNGVQQQQTFGETSFSLHSSQQVNGVQPPLGSYNTSMSMSTSSSTLSSSNKNDANTNVNGVIMMTPAEHYQHSRQHPHQGYDNFR